MTSKDEILENNWRNKRNIIESNNYPLLKNKKDLGRDSKEKKKRPKRISINKLLYCREK